MSLKTIESGGGKYNKTKLPAALPSAKTTLARNKLTTNALVAKRETTGFERTDAAAYIYRKTFKARPADDAELLRMVHTTLSEKFHMWVADTTANPDIKFATNTNGPRAWDARFNTQTYSGEYLPKTNEVRVLTHNGKTAADLEPKIKPWPGKLPEYKFPKPAESQTQVQQYVNTALQVHYPRVVGDNGSQNVQLIGANRWQATYNDKYTFSGRIENAVRVVVEQDGGRAEQQWYARQEQR